MCPEGPGWLWLQGGGMQGLSGGGAMNTSGVLYQAMDRCKGTLRALHHALAAVGLLAIMFVMLEAGERFVAPAATFAGQGAEAPFGGPISPLAAADDSRH